MVSPVEGGGPKVITARESADSAASTAAADDWRVVIPSRNDRPELLRALVAVVGPPRIVIVHTAEADVSPSIAGCTNLQYEGPINIQSWWTHGIRAAGSRFVALVNDDVGMRQNVIPTMVKSCLRTKAALARVTGHGLRGNSGYLFLVDTASGIEPDCAFQWWWGDDDLFRQAERGGGVIDVPTTGITHTDGQYQNKPEFAEMIAADYRRYMWKWGEGTNHAHRGVAVGRVNRRED